MKLMTPQDQAKIEARLSVYRCFHGGSCLAQAQKQLAKLPPDASKDWGIYFSKVQLLRRQGSEKQAWGLLLDAPSDSKQVISPDDWWAERRINFYAALYSGDKEAAYGLASHHGDVSVNPLKEAEFDAGWIALRFLKDNKRALTHFTAMRKAADGPISASQADYWIARTYEAMGQKTAAQTHLTEAARYFNSFYGQLARQTLDPHAQKLDVPSIPIPSSGAVRSFISRDSVRALVIAGKAGAIEPMRVFLADLKDRPSDEQQMVLAAHLALALGDNQLSLKIGKAGMEKGFMGLARYAYPIGAMPKFQPLRQLPEAAVFYAIARQESEFNTLTKSGAGARGILQVMPETARTVCGQYHIACEISKLMSDPAYNARLASAYIADRNDDFGGSYIMAFAGYNAGPGRVHEWINKIGDPRSPSVDPVDWVESIHLDETRDYVKKVMSNLEVYRALLDGPSNALRIRDDLVRARASAVQSD
jgi:soluble lytic murein transglycosylase